MRSGTGRSVASGRTIGTVPVIGALAATLAALPVPVRLFGDGSAASAAPADQGREDDGRGTVSTPYGPLTPTDRDFVRKVRLAGLWEPPSGRRAQELSSRKDVRTAGRHLIEGHTEPDRMSVDAGRALGVEPANRPGEQQRQWPAATGIDPDEPGSVERSDGTAQLTLGGRPVHRYARDTAPGDTRGHGVGGTWDSLAPDGTRAGPGGTGAGGEEDGPGGSPDAAPLPVADDPRLGGILVDARGRTFHRFDEDSARPMKSNRAGECLETWKPAEPADGSLVEDVGPELLGTLKRPDGTEQLPIDCRPLYWFTGDTGPGDVNGHGRGGVWHAVTEDGGKAPWDRP